MENFSEGFFKNSERTDIENYLWVFTKSWPNIYEITDREENTFIQIFGEAEIIGNIKTNYKVVIKNIEEASKFYKYIKALFILQTELKEYYKFTVGINKERIFRV